MFSAPGKRPQGEGHQWAQLGIWHGILASMCIALVASVRVRPQLDRRRIVSRSAGKSSKEPRRGMTRVGVKTRRVTVEKTCDHGIYVFDDDKARAHVPTPLLRNPLSDYIIGQELLVTWLLEAGDVPQHPDAYACDLDLQSVTELKRGDEVDGTVQTFIGSKLMMLNIGIDQVALAWQDELLPIQDCKPGDIIRGLKVSAFNPKHVFLGPPGCDLRELSSLKVGQRLNAFVAEVSVKNTAVFFDVKAEDRVVGFGFKGHLLKAAFEYERGDKVVVEVVQAEGRRVRVKDVGCWQIAGPQKLT